MTNSRRKGKTGELEFASVLRSMGFKNARRGQQFKGGADSPDIADAIDLVHIEVKRHKNRLDLEGAMEQAKRDAPQHHVPVVAHRRDRGEWLVTMPASRIEHFARSVMLTLADYEEDRDE